MIKQLIFKELKYSQNEIGQIVGLIKRNLDADFTENFFKWKHLGNPFGKSYGLVAWDGDMIIGLRVFMFWEFYNPNDQTIIRCIRPVDTVVDNAYRGQGLFKKLTLEGLLSCKGKYDFIFNTPNKNSLPGYLKMGWSESPNSENFKIGIINPFRKSVKLENFDFLNLPLLKPDTIQTNRTVEFLKWRYSDPKYIIKAYKDNLIVFSINPIKGLKGFIIYELMGETENFPKVITSVANYYKAYLVYFYNSDNFDKNIFFKLIQRKKAVVVTKNGASNIVNDLNLSLGDLEGKL